jgi:hypothetical protein
VGYLAVTLVGAAIIASLAMRTNEVARLRTWRASFVIGALGFASVLGGMATGNFFLFYGGASATYVGVVLAVVLVFGVYRDREAVLGGLRSRKL